MDVPKFIYTYTGTAFSPLDPDPNDVSIQDIAHALNNQCRFSGHSRMFYSIAQHAYYVASLVKSLGGDPFDQLCGLLHDASEAYLVDLPTPVKQQVVGYKEAEDRVMEVICEAFGISPPRLWSPLIKEADGIALATEAKFLMNGDDWDLPHQPSDLPLKIGSGWRANGAAIFAHKFYVLREWCEKNGRLLS